MLTISELIIYNNEGVCRVEDICKLNMQFVDKNKLYYILKPLYCDRVIYVPVDTQNYMRKVINYDTALELIESIPFLDVKACNNVSLRELKDCYNSLISTHNCDDLVQLIKMVYLKRNHVKEMGKKLGQTDTNYVKIAEDILYGEFAVALNIQKENVKDFIENKIKEIELSRLA